MALMRCMSNDAEIFSSKKSKAAMYMCVGAGQLLPLRWTPFLVLRHNNEL